MLSLRQLQLLSSSLYFPITGVMAGQWQLQLDNDVIIGSDGNYTNGIMLGWESALNPELKSIPLPLIWQKKLLIEQPLSETSWGIKLTQQMWTPLDISITSPQPYDRPYAGLLNFESHRSSYSDTLAQKNWFSVGVIGPASGAEQVQTIIHDITNSTPPAGWVNQISNSLTIQYAYEVDALLIRQQALWGGQWELSGTSHSQLGNFRSETELGVTFRWGEGLSNSFGRLSYHAGQWGNIGLQHNNTTLFFYTQAKIGYRFNDLTIDGSTPYTSEVTLKHQQAGLNIGVVWTSPTWSIKWGVNSYTQEYQTPSETGFSSVSNSDSNASSIDRWHSYGSVVFTWSYN